MLQILQTEIQPYREHLDQLVDMYFNFQAKTGSAAHAGAQRLEAAIDQSNDELVKVLTTQAGFVQDACKATIELLQILPKTPANVVKMDQALEDRAKIRALYAWVAAGSPDRKLRLPRSRIKPTSCKPHKSVLGKRDTSESDFEPDSRAKHKMAKPFQEIGGMFVLDLTTDSDDTTLADFYNQNMTQPRRGQTLSHHNASQPSPHTNVPRSRRQRKAAKSTIETDTENAQGSAESSPSRFSESTAERRHRASRRGACTIPIAGHKDNVATDILRAAGRHPSLQPLNQGLSHEFSGQRLQEYAGRRKGNDTEAKGELQNQLVKDVAGWWVKRGHKSP
jgi:hypothetical protein